MRLTQKHDFFEYVLPCQDLTGDTQANEIQLSDTEYTAKKYIYGEAIREFGLIEDVLEEFKLTSAEELYNCLNFTNMANCEIELELKNKIADLEQEIAGLKQKAIVIEKAFELACDPRDDWGGKEYSGTEFDNYHDYFIAEAKKELNENENRRI